MKPAFKRSILVLGCGALGGALINRLEPCAHLTVVDPFPRVSIKQHIYPNLESLNERSFDGLIVATKCYDVIQALKGLKNRIFIPRVLLLQNGVLNRSPNSRLLPQAEIVRGVTISAFGVSSRRSIVHFEGVFYLAPEDGHGNGAVTWFGRLFSEAGLKVSLVKDPLRIIWAKLIFSAVMNPLPVITGQGYEVLRKDQEVWQLVRRAVGEGRGVARALGVRLAFDPLDLILRVREGDLTGIQHKGSIYQDVVTSRSTELDYITGALVRLARHQGIKTPALNQILSRARAAGA